MVEESGSEPHFEVEPSLEIEYYLIDGEDVGRVKYNPGTEEYCYGEIMDENGEWHECPATDILMDGDEITEAEAEERVRELGGVL